MCGHQRSFRIYNYDRSDDEVKNVLVLGADGPIYAPEREFKHCWLFYTAGQSTVILDTYKTQETYEYDKIKIADLSPPKKQKKFKFVPFIYAHERKESKAYREFLQMHRVSRTELSPDDDLNLLFALDKIKDRYADLRFNVFDFLMEPNKETTLEMAEKYMNQCIAKVDVKLRVNTMRLNFAVENPLFDERFNYNHLVYRSANFDCEYKLTEKMLKCGYLCWRAKMENTAEIEKFKGWGLHILDPQENGIDLSFIRDEIKNAIDNVSTPRKLTVLTRIIPENEPLLFEDLELLELLKFIEDEGLEISFQQDEIYDIRKFTLPNSTEVALVVKHIHYTKYSSIAFINPVSDIMLKFIASGCENFFM